MKTKILSCFLTLLFALGGMAGAGVIDFSSLEAVPLQEGGRKKPYYVFATETLQSISGKGSYADGKTRRPATEVVFDIWAKPDGWQERPVVLINYKPLKEALGFPLDRKLFSLSELFASAPLKEKIGEVQKLQADPAKPKLDREQTEVRDVNARILLLHGLLSGSSFAFVPNPGSDEARWLTPGQAPSAWPNVTGGAGEAVARESDQMMKAFLAGDAAAFKAAGEKFSAALTQLRPETYPNAGVMKLEVFYGKLHPFRWAWILYAVAAITLGLTSLSGRAAGYRIAWGLIVAGFALQIFGFVARIIIGGRGPVTNMYESVIWVAFGTILFSIILEAIYRSRHIFLAATPVAVVSLILADTQTTVLKPSIDPLTPVLRDNFWLSTHVTSITLSYAAFALALGVGHIILGKVLMNRPVSSGLYNYLYRSIQIGVLLLAIGTILGGVWANYSWGRFWDWDPKETWALIALLGYLALLHGRIAGWWKGFGLAVGSVLAFQSVIMAWYGVNFVLGQGLHSYGFGTGGVQYVMSYVIAELLFVALVIVCRNRRQGGAAQSRAEEGEEIEEAV